MVPAYCSRGDVGVQCQIARYASYCHGGMKGVNRGMDTEVVGHVANRALLFWCTTELGAQRRAYGKRDVDGRPRVRLDSGNPATKGDESTTREDIEAEGTATTKPTGDVVITRLSISALSPFTRPVSSASLYLHPLVQCHNLSIHISQRSCYTIVV
jgi:hypothetical protein